MLGVGVGVQEADRDRLDAVALAGGCDRLGVRRVERDEDGAVAVDALAHLEAVAPRHERRGLARDEVVHVGAVAAADLEDVAEAAVVTSAVRAPVRSVSALITTVVPCTSSSIAAGSTSPAAITSSTPCARSRGVVETLAIRTSPVSESTDDEVGEGAADVGRDAQRHRARSLAVSAASGSSDSGSSATP